MKETKPFSMYVSTLSLFCRIQKADFFYSMYVVIIWAIHKTLMYILYLQ